MGFAKNIWAGVLAMTAAAFTAGAPALAQQPQRPNILVIMGDDIGYWNISAYNRGMMVTGHRTSIASPMKARYSPTTMDRNPVPPAARPSSPGRVHCAPGCSRWVCPRQRKVCRDHVVPRKNDHGPA